VLLHRNTIT